MARLVPVTSDVWIDMVESGKVILADDQTDLIDEPPRDYPVEATATLTAMREHER